jgi:hypothetical protein
MTITFGIRLYAIAFVFCLSILPHALCVSSDMLAVDHFAHPISRRTDCPTKTCGGGCGSCAADECCSEKVPTFGFSFYEIALIDFRDGVARANSIALLPNVKSTLVQLAMPTRPRLERVRQAQPVPKLRMESHTVALVFSTAL